jgi:hypothetical protein
MIEKTKKRLEAVEQSLNPRQGASDFPDPLEELTAGERAIIRPYMEARIMGHAHEYGKTEGLQPAMYKYLKACVQRDLAMRAAGVPMRSIAEALRDRSPRNTALELAELAARFDAIEGRTKETEGGL